MKPWLNTSMYLIEPHLLRVDINLQQGTCLFFTQQKDWTISGYPKCHMYKIHYMILLHAYNHSKTKDGDYLSFRTVLQFCDCFGCHDEIWFAINKAAVTHAFESVETLSEVSIPIGRQLLKTLLMFVEVSRS